MLLEMVEAEVRLDMAALVRRLEAESKELATKKASKSFTLAIQKCATDQSERRSLGHQSAQ
jgi:hypothetical protein